HRSTTAIYTLSLHDALPIYSATGGINYLDAAANLPSRQAIEAVCAELMSLMFPGFRGEALVDSADLPDITRSRIRNLRTRLKPEDRKSTRLNSSHLGISYAV